MLVLKTDWPCVLFAGDVEQLAQFWQRALHLSLGRQRDNQVELVNDGQRVLMVIRRVMPPRPRVRIRLTAFDARDVGAAVERLVRLGASTQKGPYSTAGRATVTDPHGNIIEITTTNMPQT
ncbi:VOC family protein [Gordonia neofelifaecis]|uniref:VOC domain-containing protein n=1 Tax=Gordonia neofelifaecis NRRL B-59395 TaxID=644548 RepID=F1YMJ8_9ACTN|nr:VOC family protein [Gordonia neofelifaecis]EGD54123.1 hypothetical protein SCNU_15414 [Gordonia neofelifaecis NRRL B-59395]